MKDYGAGHAKKMAAMMGDKKMAVMMDKKMGSKKPSKRKM